MVEDTLAPILGTVTARQLERIIDQVVARHDPDSARAKVEQAKKGREVWFGHSRDDHADIVGTLDSIGAEVLDRRLDQLAKAIGRVVRARGEQAGFGPVDESWTSVAPAPWSCSPPHTRWPGC